MNDQLFTEFITSNSISDALTEDLKELKVRILADENPSYLIIWEMEEWE